MSENDGLKSGRNRGEKITEFKKEKDRGFLLLALTGEVDVKERYMCYKLVLLFSKDVHPHFFRFDVSNLH